MVLGSSCYPAILAAAPDRRPAIKRVLFITLLSLFSLSARNSLGQASADAAVRPVDRMASKWWKERHEAILREIPNHTDSELLLIGDSITNNYDKHQPPDEDFAPTWDQFYSPRKALNLGFSGDTTSNVLWRLQHGEVAGLRPKVAILLIGTNDTSIGHESASETEVGIDAVVAELQRRLPTTHILVLGILPSALSSEKSRTDAAVNAYLARAYSCDPRATYLDITSIFLKNGILDQTLFYDPRLPQHRPALHPDTHGQLLMAEAIEPTLARWMDDTPRVRLASSTDNNTALIPVPRLEQDSYDWFARHQAVLRAQQQIRPAVVLLGDSITHFWAGQPYAAQSRGAAAWQSLFGDTPTLNLGFGWDRTQNVLWRLEAGELNAISPRWIIINIGTNNLVASSHARANTPAEIAAAMVAICTRVRALAPSSQIVVMALFPRGQDRTVQIRKDVDATNALIAEQFRGRQGIHVLDLGSSFVKPDGTLDTSLLPDGLHPNAAGYDIWAKGLAALGIPN